VDDVADLQAAGARSLAALYDPRRVHEAELSRAGALVVPESCDASLAPRPRLVAARPKAVFARAIELVRPVERPAAGIHPSAVVDRGATLGENVAIGPHVVVEDGATIGEGAILGAGAIVMRGATVGEAAEIHPRAVLYPGTLVGRRVRVLAGAVLGAPGFGHAHDETGRALRVPHLGQVVLEEDVEVGANATIDRGTFGETRLAARARIDNLVQVGHNAKLGEDAMMAAQSGLSGSSRIGRGVVVGGQSGLADHVSVGDGAAVAAKTAVFADVPEGQVVAGTPAMPISRWRRLAAIQGRLPDLWRTIKRLASNAERDGA
jgi:UDP-3-O-[3-hydroxymyristoyl] glucosamine N-acyltransferase